MSSQPNETPQEDIRNALQLLAAEEGEHTPEYWESPFCANLRAIRARLEAALTKLADAEGLASGRREWEIAQMQDRAEQIAREFPPLHDLYAEAHGARMDGAPLAGQEITEDGE